MNSTDKLLVVPATITEPAATAAFSEWLSAGIWPPHDLKALAQHGTIAILHLPFYCVEAEARSEWSGRSGTRRYRRVTRTRKIMRDNKSIDEEYEVDEPYTEWHDKEGTHSQAYSDIFLGTSKFYPALISEIAGYARESINAGRKNKFTAVSKDAIHPETSTTDETQVESAFQARITATQREACRKQVDKLGEVSTTVDITKNTLVYYPIWMCPYSYDGKDYLCIVPGTKNSPLGTKPLSLTKVGVAIAAVAILLGVLWFYTSHMARPL